MLYNSYKTKVQFVIIAFFLSTLLFTNCIYVFMKKREKTLQEKALESIYYISDSKQQNKLKKLHTREEIQNFLEDFWDELDPTPGTYENEVLNEYAERFKYAQTHFPDRPGWGKSDKGRIYILYGPPDEILHFPWLKEGLNQTPWVRSMDVWIYDKPAGPVRVPETFKNMHPQQMKFVFADLTGLGVMQQIFSTEVGEICDPRIYGEKVP